MQTFAGINFMASFNAWYYSFSPAVADYERQSPALQSVVRVGVYPLIGILDLSALAYDVLSLAGMNSEAGIVIAGLTASSLIGLVFFTPIPALLAILKDWRLNSSRIRQISALTWLVAAATVAAASFTLIQELMMFGSGLLVISTIFAVVVFVVQRASRLRNALFSRN
jgi:hypothetical protein